MQIVKASDTHPLTVATVVPAEDSAAVGADSSPPLVDAGCDVGAAVGLVAPNSITSTGGCMDVSKAVETPSKLSPLAVAASLIKAGRADAVSSPTMT